MATVDYEWAYELLTPFDTTPPRLTEEVQEKMEELFRTTTKEAGNVMVSDEDHLAYFFPRSMTIKVGSGSIFKVKRLGKFGLGTSAHNILFTGFCKQPKCFVCNNLSPVHCNYDPFSYIKEPIFSSEYWELLRYDNAKLFRQ